MSIAAQQGQETSGGDGSGRAPDGWALRLSSLEELGFGPLLRVGVGRVYPAGASLFHQGQRPDCFAVVGWGRLQECLTTNAGRSVFLGFHGSGDIVAFASALSGEPCRASVLAVQETGCLIVVRDRLLSLLAGDPRLLGSLLGTLTRNLVACSSCLVEATCDRVETRLARLFLNLLADTDAELGSGRIHPRLSRHQLAEFATTTEETCSRVMSRWRRQRILLTSDDGFEVRDVAALREIADGKCQ